MGTADMIAEMVIENTKDPFIREHLRTFKEIYDNAGYLPAIGDWEQMPEEEKMGFIQDYQYLDEPITEPEDISMTRGSSWEQLPDNELMVLINGGQWIYFPTHLTSADRAFREFCRTMDAAGINADNLKFVKAELRNKDQDNIDVIEF